MRYSKVCSRANIALNAATPVLLFPTPTLERVGVRLFNNSLINIYVVQMLGTTVPTLTTMVTNGERYSIITSGGFMEDFSEDGIWYGMSASGTPNLLCEEVAS